MTSIYGVAHAWTEAGLVYKSTMTMFFLSCSTTPKVSLKISQFIYQTKISIMKFIQLAIALTSAAVVAAQTTTGCAAATSAIPTCGVACITSAAEAVGCAYTDYACQCSSSASSAIQASAIGCVVSSCGLGAFAVSASAAAVCTACV